jgi:hypothetical protein
LVFSSYYNGGAEPITRSDRVAWGPDYLIPILPFITNPQKHISHLNKKAFLKILVATARVNGTGRVIG